MDFLISLFSFIAILGLLIFLHELGHFLVARLFHVKVETFSLGFGKRLWGVTRGGVDYRISMIPLGGYVKMAGEHLGEERSGSPDEFLSKPRWQRALIMLAGPMMNLMLALVLITANYTIGIPTPTFFRQPARVGFVIPKGPAEKSGIRLDDVIVSIGGVKIHNWSEFQLQALGFSRQKVNLEVLREGKTLTIPIDLAETETNPSEVTGLYPFIDSEVDSVAPGSPAQKAGLQPGDDLLTVQAGSKTASGYLAITQLIQQSVNSPVILTVRRGDKTIVIPATPQASKEKGMQGRGQLGFYHKIPVMLDRLPFFEAFQRSVKDNAQFVAMTYRVLGKVITGRLSVKQFSGPIGIAKASGDAVKTFQITVIFSFIALISMNLAVLNLLPIPVLDGGMLFLLSIEMLIRRDLPMHWKERAVQAGFFLLVGFMALVVVLDLVRSLGH